MKRTLRNLKEEDLPELVAWRNDPKVNQYLASRVQTLDEARTWFKRITSDKNNLLKGIYLDGRLVGYCIVEAVDSTRRKCELGVVVARRAWGKGLGRLALRHMLKHCFNTLHLHRALAVIARGNERSEGLFRGSGFVHEGTLREATLIHGHFTDLLCYSLLEKEYKNR